MSAASGTGGKEVIAGQEEVAGCGGEMTGTREEARGHLVDRKRMTKNVDRGEECDGLLTQSYADVLYHDRRRNKK